REPLRLIPIALVDYVRFGFLPALKLFRAMVDYPVAERARLVTVPTLIVVGERDPLVSERRILDAFADLQQVTAVRIRGAAHAINFSHPDELAQVVRRFLTGQPIDDDPYLKERTVVIASPG